jgi:Kef-type K+ transport system membrane component KefB
MEVLELFTLALVMATLSGVALQYFRVSPVIAYILAGALLNFFGVDLNSQVFQFLATLAVQLLAFRIGLTFDASTVKQVFGRASIIVLVEVLLIGSTVSALSAIIGLNVAEAVLLFATAVNTSSFIAFKQSRSWLPAEDFKIVMAVCSLEDIVAFVALAALTGQLLSAYSAFILLVEGLASFALGYWVAKRIISFTLTKYPKELSTLAVIASVLIFALLGNTLNIPEVLPPLVFGLAMSYALSSKPFSGAVFELESRLEPLIEFFLVIFFVMAGQRITVSPETLVLVPAALGIIFLKFLSFGVGYWIVQGDFARAFATGLNMTGLSEFGIVVGLSALSMGYKLGYTFDLAVIAFGTSTTLSGFLVTRTNSFREKLSSLQKRSVVLKELNNVLVMLKGRLYVPSTLNQVSAVVFKMVSFLGAIALLSGFGMGLAFNYLKQQPELLYSSLGAIAAGALISSFYVFYDAFKDVVTLVSINRESRRLLWSLTVLGYLLFALGLLSVLGAITRVILFDIVMISIILGYAFYVYSKGREQARRQRGNG